MAIIRYHNINEITGDILKVTVPIADDAKEVIQPRLDDIAIVHTESGKALLAQIINIENQMVSLQIYGGTKGLSTKSSVSFPGHPMMINYSANIFGRVFNGTGL